MGYDKLPFHQYYSIKDLLGFILVFLLPGNLTYVNWSPTCRRSVYLCGPGVNSNLLFVFRLVTASVFSLQLQADSLLLCGDDVLPGGGLLLHCLLPLDLGKAGVNFVLPDGFQGSLFLIKLLVDRLGVGRALCLDKVGHHDGEAHAHVEVVLHDEVFLGSKEGGDTEECHVGTSHTSLGVEGVEPLSWEDQCLHGPPLNWPLAGRSYLTKMDLRRLDLVAPLLHSPC